MEKIEVIIKKASNSKSVFVPVGKLSNVDNADNLLYFASVLKDIIKEIEEATTPLILENKGSEHFNYVSSSESKKVNWNDIKEECKIPDSVIEKHTETITKKPYLKKKKGLLWFI